MSLLLRQIDKGRSFLIRDLEKDFHSQYGVIKKEQLKKAKPGDIISTQLGKAFLVEPITFRDLFNKIERRAQIIPIKDYATIIANTMPSKNSVCLDAGTGSGALACFMARFVKLVISYDLREEHQKIAIKNADYLGIENIEFRIGNIFNPEEIDLHDMDLFTLDVTTPWDAIKTAEKALKTGGFLVSYSPNLTQIVRTVNAIDKSESIKYIKVVETIEREWDVKEDRILRPKLREIAHSGFLLFAKKIA